MFVASYVLVMCLMFHIDATLQVDWRVGLEYVLPCLFSCWKFDNWMPRWWHGCISGVQLGRVLAYELFDIDQDFIFKYKKLVEQTTANDVLKAAQVHLHPESQTVLIVTDVQKVQPLLAASGIPVVQLRPSYLNGRWCKSIQRRVFRAAS